MVFLQVHQTKKSNKWECKLCGEKQSIKRHYELGTGKECRLHVQKLNGIRGEIDELNESIELTKNDEDDEELEDSSPHIKLQASDERKTSNESKWSNFIEETECPTSEENESMYLGNTEVVLEVPVRKRKKYKPPTSTVESLPNMHNYEPNKSEYKYEQSDPAYNYEPVNRQRKTSKAEPCTSNYSSFFKSKFNVQATISNPEVPVKNNSLPLPYVTNEKVTEKLSIRDVNDVKLKMYEPPKVNQNSKWAEFVDEPDENEPRCPENSLENKVSSQDNIEENNQKTDRESTDREKRVEFLQSRANPSENVGKNLFMLCDESELDDVLQF